MRWRASRARRSRVPALRLAAAVGVGRVRRWRGDGRLRRRRREPELAAGESLGDEDDAGGNEERAGPATPIDRFFEEDAGEDGFRDEGSGGHGDRETHGGYGDEFDEGE